VHQSKLKRISLAVCLALMPFAANAAGLGKLSVISGLGEPLNAEIELLSTDADELATLTAAIAPEDAYSVQGIDRTPIHSSIKIELGKKPDGTPVLRLSTRQPVSDPFLDMLIQVDWATGRLLREYTALLDPPGYTSQTSTPQSSTSSSQVTNGQKEAPSPVASGEAPVAKIKASGTNKSYSKKTASKASQNSESAIKADSSSMQATSAEDYTTQRGDTLHAIASNMQVEGVSLDQMLVGLYRANKNAFDGNMNRLKVGQIIHALSKDELDAISAREARTEIHAQAADWNAYRNKLAGMVADIPATEQSKTSQSSGGKITAKAEDKALPEAAGPKDVVKLSKNDTGQKNASVNAKAVQDKLNSLQEEATAREKSVQEANDRTAALEKQIADMQKLLAIKNQAMVDLQKNAAVKASPAPIVAEPPKAEPAKPPVEAAKPVAPPPAPAATVVEPPKPASGIEPPKPEQVAKPPEENKPSVTDKPKPKKKHIAPPAQPVPPPVAESVAEPDLLSSILENPVILGGIAGLILILGGVWAFLRNKRKRNLDGFEQAILTSGGLKANTVFGNTAGGSIDTGSSFLTDFSQSGSGMIDTNDVDPIAEAEVYMAYGRDTQAEEILKDAISKEPKRYELHLKLLEILASRKDTSGFETIAGELYTSLGAGDPTWDKVADMGRKMEPDNPLYQMSAPTASAEDMVQNQKLDASEFDSAEVMSESSLDFSVDSGVDNLEDITATDDEEIASLDFDLGTSDSKMDETISFDTPLESGNLESSSETDNDDLDFQLDIGSPDENVNESIAEIESSASLDLSSSQTIPGLDMPELGVSDSSPKSNVEEEEPDFGSTMPSLEMPDLSISEKTNQEIESLSELELPAMDFDVGSDSELDTAPEAKANEAEVITDISFDLPDIGVSDVAPELASNVTDIDMELPDFSKTMVIKSSETTPDDIVFDSPESSDSGLDVNFDLDISDMGDTSANGDSASSTMDDLPSLDSPEMAALPELDLSGISLDLDESPAPIAQPTTVAEIAESSEVDTKLDLVTAYIDMGDAEGARELLDEVLKEGGPSQRKKAEELLSSMG